MSDVVVDDVRVHPRGARDEGIRGVMRLTPAPASEPQGEDGASSRLEWAPTPGTRAQQLEAAGYSFSVTLREVRAIRRAKPARGSGAPGGALTLVTCDGVSLGPLYFHRTGGLPRLWSELETRVALAETPGDPTLFRVNDASDQLARSIIAFRTSAAASPPETAAAAIAAATAAEGGARHTAAVGPARLADWQLRVWEGLGSVVRFLSAVPRSPIPSDLPTNTHFPILANQPTEVGTFELVGSNGAKAAAAAAASGGATPAAKQPADRMLQSESLESLPVGRREKPLSATEWVALFDSEGRIKQRGREELLSRAFFGGFSEDIRCEAWKFMLGFYEYDTTSLQRQVIARQRAEEYHVLRSQWQTVRPDQEAHCSKFRSRKEQVAKDVHRTDRDYPFFSGEDNVNLRKLSDVLLTYVQFNQDLGYAQGMNDLAAIVLNVMGGDEVSTFWCFKKLMDRLGASFRKDQVGMHTQLRALSRIVATMDPQLFAYLESIKSTEMFFCFRWLLVFFKREFSFDTTKRLWEALLSDHLTLRFELFFAAAIVIRNREKILSQEMQFDEILQLMNRLSGTMAVEPILVEAECLFLAFLRCADRDLKTFILSCDSTTLA